MRQTTRVAAAVLIALVMVFCAPVAGWAQARARLLQSVDVRIPVPPTPVSIAGKRHLAYELHIANFRRGEIALTRVAVSNADLAALADLHGADLTRRLGHPGAVPEPADKRIISAGTRAVVYLWLALDDGTATPSKLRHRIEFDVTGPSGREHAAVENIVSEVRNDPPVVLSAPLRGGPWVALYDPFMAHGHRTSIYAIDGRARIPARFAIDWIRLDSDATHARGDESRIANWHGYGLEVLAVADSIVAAAKDDLSEHESISDTAQPVALENASGNYVTLDLGKGRYAFYEHLQPGSITVRPGERVKSGQVIGLLGNSGSSSSGPHLHFHVSDANSPLAAEGLPYVFREFKVLGAYERIGDFASDQQWNPVPPAAGGRRDNELPAANTVVVFRRTLRTRELP